MKNVKVSNGYVWESTYAQYLRLSLRLSDSNVAVIRKARRMLAHKGKARANREARHIWLRSLIRHHEKEKVCPL